MLPLAVQAAMASIEKICPEARNLLLIPERHTRNTFYLQNVARLAVILRQTGLNVRLGSLSDEITKPTTIELPDGQRLVLEPLSRIGLKGRRLGLKDFDPCAILLNNDLSAGVPPILKNLHEQYVLPPLHAGWSTRRKSNHFACYDDVIKKFSKILDIDPWILNPYFATVKDVDFNARVGEEELQETAAGLLKKVAKKYKQMGIKEKKPIDVLINGLPFDKTKTYKVLTNDFCATGGDQMWFFTGAKESTDLNIILRDAIITKFRQLGSAGIELNSKLDNRIYKADAR
jgi:glutamate--cysteine ligase